MIENHENINEQYFSLIIRIAIAIFLGLLLLIFIFWHQTAYANPDQLHKAQQNETVINEEAYWVPLLRALTILIRETYPGQYAQYTEQERNWFKSVKSPKGVSCCDIADGHKTTWRHGPETEINSGYEVPINDEWLPVPKAAIVYNAGNPIGEAIVWYIDQGSYTAEGENVEHHHYFIRCFVPDGGV